MAERAVRNSKSDVALQAQSTREKKGKGKGSDNKGKGSYNNSTGRVNQEKWSLSNQRRPSYQSNRKVGVASKGRGGGQKPEKSHIQCFNCQKYGHYSTGCLVKQ